MMVPIRIKEEDRILIIAPHPDDECIGCGGVLALYANQCDVIVLTDGRYGHISTSPEDLELIRKKEFCDEMEYLGLKSIYWEGIPDGELMQHLGCLENYNLSDYDFIFIPWYEDNHPDHTAAFLCVKEQSHKIKGEVYQYEVHVPFHDPDSMIDISEVINEKIKLIRFHKSQLESLCYDMKAEALAKYRACSMNNQYGYIEAYVKTDLLNFGMTISNDAQVREQKIAKSTQFIGVLSKWLENRINRIMISDWLNHNGISRVSIYGFSNLGRLLYLDLLACGVEVVQILDNRKLKNDIGNHDVIIPGSGDRNVDVIIVSAVHDFDSIMKELHELGYSSVVSLKEIVENKG